MLGFLQYSTVQYLMQRFLPTGVRCLIEASTALICRAPGGMKIIPAPLSSKSSRGRQGRNRARASAKLHQHQHQHQHQRLRVRAKYGTVSVVFFIPTCLCDAAAFSSHSLPSSLPTLLFMLRNIVVNHYGRRHLSFAAARIRNRCFFSMSTSSHPSRVSLKGHT